MRPSFADAFVVVDKLDWKLDGVLLIFKDGSTAAKYGSSNLILESPVPETGGLAFRIKLEDAMHTMMLRDQSRALPKTEESILYQIASSTNKSLTVRNGLGQTF